MRDGAAGNAFLEAIGQGAEALGVPISSPVLDRLGTYQTLLEKWAPKVNLVADWNSEVTAGVHFVDSIAVSRVLPETGRLIDIGTGAGFPGLVLAMVQPDRPVTLIEPIGKRASFLQQVVIHTGLQNCRVEIARTHQLRPFSDAILITRAVFPPIQWLQEASRLLERGSVVVMTAESLDARTREKGYAAGLRWVREDAFTLPLADVPRCNSMFESVPE